MGKSKLWPVRKRSSFDDEDEEEENNSGKENLIFEEKKKLILLYKFCPHILDKPGDKIPKNGEIYEDRITRHGKVELSERQVVTLKETGYSMKKL